MRIPFAAAVVHVLMEVKNSQGFTASSGATTTVSSSRGRTNWMRNVIVAASTVSPTEAETLSNEFDNMKSNSIDDDDDLILLGWSEVSKMTYRMLQKQLKARGLSPIGTTAALQARLYEALGGECVVEDGKAIGICDDDQVAKAAKQGIAFSDLSNSNVDFDDMVAEITEKAEINHWKVATRKLKQLRKKLANSQTTTDRVIPPQLYLLTLRACMANRLNGARASEPARKIMEEMSDMGYAIPKDVVNYCIQNSLGDGPDGTHDGCGGIDCALAMMAVADSMAGDLIDEDTYGRVASVLAKSGDIEEAKLVLRRMIVDKTMTPPLKVIADIAMAAATSKKEGAAITMNILSLAKAAGYQLDSIASTDEGRALLAAGIIASEKLDNMALGLRLFTAASQATGCEPDRGDTLLATSSGAVQRAATLIHRKAIIKAVEQSEWKLAVKVMQLMTERGLKTSPTIWKRVVTCCAKSEKSRKATSLLLDWVKLADAGEMEKPPISVFNSVVNACEICDEQELTLLVLDTMRKTHDTDGNIITFNIALKRLAKLGNVAACEAIIIGMLQQEVEPSVVSYTTAIAACAVENNRNPPVAYEWLRRMRSRNVRPNVISYNTALAACLDGKLESTLLGSKIASEMLADVDRQLEEGVKGNAYTTVFPDKYTKTLARRLMKQLRENWRGNEIDMRLAKATVRQPLLQLVDFDLSDRAKAAAAALEAAAALGKRAVDVGDDDDDDDADSFAIDQDETDLEYATAASLHRTAEV